MTAWSELLDYRLRKTYLASGAVRPLIFLADFKVGRLNNLIEKCGLFLSYTFGRNLLKLAKKSEIIASDYKEAGFDTCLLYNTGWYKPINYIGVCQRNHQSYFTKHFKDSEKANEQITNFDFVNKYFSGSFLLPKHERHKTIVFYKFVQKSGKRHDDVQILQRMLHCAASNLQAYGILKSLASFVPDDMIYQLHQNKMHALAGKIEAHKGWFSGQIACTPVHGDFTPWNIIIDKEDKVVLIDYERAGWHVYLYDCLHYVLQSSAFRGDKMQIYSLLKKHFPEQDESAIVKSCFAYLIDQIYNDLHALQDCNHTNWYLIKALAIKGEWLSSLLDGVKND